MTSTALERLPMNEIAALATVLAQQQVRQAVAVKVLGQANAQDQAVLSLLDAAMEMAAEMQAAVGAGRLDTYA